MCRWLRRRRRGFSDRGRAWQAYDDDDDTDDTDDDTDTDDDDNDVDSFRRPHGVERVVMDRRRCPVVLGMGLGRE